MPAAPTDAFLSGQGIPVDPGRVEDELSNLWGPAAERAGGPELENPSVTRVVLANLVVEADEASRGGGSPSGSTRSWPGSRAGPSSWA